MDDSPGPEYLRNRRFTNGQIWFFMELAGMSRQEQDREDLFAELRAARSKWEFRTKNCELLLVAGIYGDGRFSIYFGQDVYYRFDSLNRLQRAVIHGSLFRTQGRTLARLQRHRTSQETQLLRHDLDDLERAEFLAEMKDRLAGVLSDLNAGQYDVLRFQGDAEVSLSNLQDRLSGCLDAEPALAPAFPTRKK